MARSAPILNRDTSHLLFALKPPHSLTSLRLTKPPLLLPSSLSSSSCVTRVTTIPVEYAPPAPEFEFHRDLACLKSLRSRLASSKSLRAKTRVIDGDSRGLPDLGEIYPLGGSADRLGLVDPDTGECLPATMLPYCGQTLLEGLIRDLQAREFLYFKVYGKQCITPVSIMTSAAKNNHEHISSLCEKLDWFKRGRSRFQLFEQPLVPAFSAEDGQWIIKKPFTPICKPGGRGVIWKLAYDKGVFQWFYDHGRKGATVRQVSHVVAATDLTRSLSTSRDWFTPWEETGVRFLQEELRGYRRN